MKINTKPGFTLVELLVSTAIITLLMVVLVAITGQTNATWRYTRGRIEQFREARTAFETMTTRLSQATLNTYWDYNSVDDPKNYERQSELRFISGKKNANGVQLLEDGQSAGRPVARVTHSVFFHAPLGFDEPSDSNDKSTLKTDQTRGLENLLNVWGYYVELADDAPFVPSFFLTMPAAQRPTARHRFRLMEFMQPASALSTYTHTSGLDGPAGERGTKLKTSSYYDIDWFSKAMGNANPPVHVLAENVIALIILPLLPKQDLEDLKRDTGVSKELAPNYDYDSTKDLKVGSGNSPEQRALRAVNPRNQLPPLLQVTLVAIDEPTALRLNLQTPGSKDIFGVQGKFEKASDFEKDLLVDQNGGANASLENKLLELKANYRVFTTNIPLRSAKWSREQ